MSWTTCPPSSVPQSPASSAITMFALTMVAPANGHAHKHSLTGAAPHDRAGHGELLTVHRSAPPEFRLALLGEGFAAL